MGQADPSPDAPGLPDPAGVADLPQEWDATDEATRARLIDAVYPKLKEIAEGHMRRERPDHTLQATALVNEFFLILARQRRLTVKGRAHFLAIASLAMRRLLIDYARSHRTQRRGGAAIDVQLDPESLPVSEGTVDALVLDEALDRLAAEEPRMAKVVEMKCFGGLTFFEIGEVLSIDERTAKRDWMTARARLYRFLNSKKESDAG
jgi:RNA polymerase sigma factor (TIGR02999 family)